jgi:hypothetical protein
MKNWPTLVAMLATAIVGGLAIFHVITSEQAAALGALMVPFTAYVHRMDPPSSGGPPAVASAGIVLLAFALSGCSRFMHFSDPTLDSTVTDLCSTLAVQERPKLEAEAKRQGVSLNVLQDIFEAACALRVKQGLSPARAAGMAAARHEAESDAGAP